MRMPWLSCTETGLSDVEYFWNGQNTSFELDQNDYFELEIVFFKVKNNLFGLSMFCISLFQFPKSHFILLLSCKSLCMLPTWTQTTLM